MNKGRMVITTIMDEGIVVQIARNCPQGTLVPNFVEPCNAFCTGYKVQDYVVDLVMIVWEKLPSIDSNIIH